jgi:hypothetical protein
MTPFEWIELSGVVVGAISAVNAGFAWIGRLFFRNLVLEMKADNKELLATHEREDEKRHNENIRRFTRLETILQVKNGG